MEVLENLQELKELNQRQANVDFEAMLKQYKEMEQEQKRREQEEDEQEIKAMLEQAQNRRLLVDSDSDEEPAKPHVKPEAKTKPTDILQEARLPQQRAPPRPPSACWGRIRTARTARVTERDAPGGPSCFQRPRRSWHRSAEPSGVPDHVHPQQLPLPGPGRARPPAGRAPVMASS